MRREFSTWKPDVTGACSTSRISWRIFCSYRLLLLKRRIGNLSYDRIQFAGERLEKGRLPRPVTAPR